MYTTPSGQMFTDLRDAHAATRIGGVIEYNGKPSFIVTSPTRLDFVAN